MSESYNNNIKGLKGREWSLTDFSEFPVTGKTTTRYTIRKQTLREGERGRKERERERGRKEREREGDRRKWREMRKWSY